MKRLLFVLILLAAWPAQAQMTDNSATVGTSASTVLAAATNRSFILLYNRSSNTIYCSWTATAVANAAGTFGLVGLGANLLITKPQVIPGNALSCIASGASSGLTALTIP